MHRTRTAKPGEDECKRMEMSAQPSRHKFKKSMYLRYGNGEAVLYDKYNSRFVGRGGAVELSQLAPVKGLKAAEHFSYLSCALRTRAYKGIPQRIEIGGGIANSLTTVEKDSMVMIEKKTVQEIAAMDVHERTEYMRQISDEAEEAYLNKALNKTPKDGLVKERKDIKHIEKHCAFCGKPLERKRYGNRLEDFTVFSNRKYCNRDCMAKAFDEVEHTGKSWYVEHLKAREIKGNAACEICGSTENVDVHHIDGDWHNNDSENLMCLCRSCHMKTHNEKGGDDMTNTTNIRIRKLTPKECWRIPFDGIR